MRANRSAHLPHRNGAPSPTHSPESPREKQGEAFAVTADVFG